MGGAAVFLCVSQPINGQPISTPLPKPDTRFLIPDTLLPSPCLLDSTTSPRYYPCMTTRWRAFSFIFLGCLALLCVFILGIGRTTAPAQQETLVIIPKGTGVQGACQLLAQQAVVEAGLCAWRLFYLYYSAHYQLLASGSFIHAGEYAFPAGVRLSEVLRKLTEGEVYYRKLTIPEGLMSSEVLALLGAAEGLVGELPETVPEGSILPETYSYTYGQTRADILRTMQRKQDEAWEQAWPSRAADFPLSMEEARVLASIVEKETGLGNERDKVASVYLNRLKKGMKLQADPTTIYGITLGKAPLGREISRKDLQAVNAYNTYVVSGLPPTPICNAGLASINATLNPAKTDYYYFVASGEGGHLFGKTLEEHNRNVNIYRKSQRNKAP